MNQEGGGEPADLYSSGTMTKNPRRGEINLPWRDRRKAASLRATGEIFNSLKASPRTKV